jgi:hypothetical protein
MKKSALKIKRHYVSIERLKNGEREEISEDEFSARELKEIYEGQTDRMMEAVGYERVRT